MLSSFWKTKLLPRNSSQCVSSAIFCDILAFKPLFSVSFFGKLESAYRGKDLYVVSDSQKL